MVDAFEKAEAAIAPIYDIGQIFEDPHFKARDTVTTVQDPQLGPIRMQNVFPQLSMTPGRIRHPGPDVGEHTDDILAELIAEGRLTADTAERIKAAFAKGPKD